jgi:hypothetical protein
MARSQKQKEEQALLSESALISLMWIAAILLLALYFAPLKVKADTLAQSGVTALYGPETKRFVGNADQHMSLGNLNSVIAMSKFNWIITLLPNDTHFSELRCFERTVYDIPVQELWITINSTCGWTWRTPVLLTTE